MAESHVISSCSLEIDTVGRHNTGPKGSGVILATFLENYFNNRPGKTVNRVVEYGPGSQICHPIQAIYL